MTASRTLERIHGSVQKPNRREFLGGAVMTGASLAFPGILAAAENAAGWQPKLALSSVMFSGLSLQDFCATAAQLGFKGIDLWGPFDKCRHMLEAVELGADGFGKLLERHGLEVGAWTHYGGSQNPDRGFPVFAEFIGACGGGVVVRESKYGDTAEHQLEDAVRRFYEDLKPEIELARKHKVRLAIENHGSAILDGPESFEIFSRLNPAPDAVGFAVAPYHLQHRKANIGEIIRKHGDQLLFFYAWQSGNGTSQLPGHGPADFTPWMKALAETNFSHWITPFMHGELPAEEMSSAVAKAKTHLITQADHKP